MLKFSAARKVVGETGKEVLLWRTLAYGSHYGIGVFCPMEAGEQQIGWVPEIDSASAENMGDKFTKMTIFIICGALWNN